MSHAPERSFYTSYDHRYIRIDFLEDLRIDSDGIVRSLTGLAFRRICIIRAETLRSRIMIDH